MPDDAIHPALSPGRTAVITGAAGGIGLAAAKRVAGLGLRVVMADVDADALGRAADAVRAVAQGGTVVEAVPCDVSVLADVERLRDVAVGEGAGQSTADIALVMNNAAIAGRAAAPWTDIAHWRRLLDINLWGVINGVQTFVPPMLGSGRPGLIVNTGSKQGLTGPPGAYAYNLSKAGVRSLTEAVSYEFSRMPDCRLSAHLLIPGYTFTGMTRREGQMVDDKPAAAWTSKQVVDFMLESIARGDFYVLCPDNDVSRALDCRRLEWTTGDITRNRPPLSRWRPEYKEEFEAFLREAGVE